METNWAMFILVAILSGTAVYIGRLWFKRWINPFSLYSATWGFCICNYYLRLIQYEQITRLAWTYIILSWACLYLGAATVLFLKSPIARPTRAFEIDINRLRRAILLLGSIGAIGVIDQIRTLNSQFGSALGAIFGGA